MHPSQDVHQRAFAGTILAHDCMDFTLCKLDCDATECIYCSELLGDFMNP